MSPHNPLLKDMISSMMQKSEEFQRKLTEIAIILERNTVNLEEHMRRTEIAEKRLDAMEFHPQECPARKKADASAFVWDKVRDASLIIGLAVLLFKDLWPSLVKFFNP